MELPPEMGFPTAEWKWFCSQPRQQLVILGPDPKIHAGIRKAHSHLQFLPKNYACLSSASSSSISPSSIDRPCAQNDGSVASSPKGASSSE